MEPNLFTIQDKAFPRGLQYAVVDYSLENSEPVQIVQQFSLFIVAYVISSALQASRFAQVCISKFALKWVMKALQMKTALNWNS